MILSATDSRHKLQKQTENTVHVEDFVVIHTETSKGNGIQYGRLSMHRKSQHTSWRGMETQPQCEHIGFEQ